MKICLVRMMERDKLSTNDNKDYVKGAMGQSSKKHCINEAKTVFQNNY